MSVWRLKVTQWHWILKIRCHSLNEYFFVFKPTTKLTWTGGTRATVLVIPFTFLSLSWCFLARAARVIVLVSQYLACFLRVILPAWRSSDLHKNGFQWIHSIPCFKYSSTQPCDLTAHSFSYAEPDPLFTLSSRLWGILNLKQIYCVIHLGCDIF